jgi:tight adherence protein C
LIAKQLPYTLDLVALVMAAGSSFAEAIETLIRDQPDEDLNQELQIALSEMEYGAPRNVALKNLAERIPLESLRSVVAAVNQSERLGTPMSSILKLQADMLRAQRGVVAEKKSASASLRILIPSMMIMISVVTILFSPMIIRYIQGDLF